MQTNVTLDVAERLRADADRRHVSVAAILRELVEKQYGGGDGPESGPAAGGNVTSAASGGGALRRASRTLSLVGVLTVSGLAVDAAHAQHSPAGYDEDGRRRRDSNPR